MGLKLRKYITACTVGSTSCCKSQVEKFVLKGLHWPLWLTEGYIHRFANLSKGCTSIAINMSVYLCVCLFMRISLEQHVQSLPNFLCVLPPVVAQSFSGEGGKVCYLWLPCCLCICI